MTFLAPGFFVASLAISAAVAALHFIVTRQPRAAVFPTARFVPDLPASATARATRPSDLLLMLLRVLLVLAVGAGLARPVFTPSRSASARVILVDRSRSVSDVAALRDSVSHYYRDGDAVVVFDSAAHTINGNVRDSLNRLIVSNARGRLSGGLIAALRAGSGLRDRADSLEFVIVSPLAVDEMDAATDSIRALWRGRAKVVVAGAGKSFDSSTRAVESKTLPGDPLAFATSRAQATSGERKLVRTGLSADDLPWVNDSTRTAIDWPTFSRPRGASLRERADATGGVASGESVVISSFPRKWRFTSDSIRGGEVVARWLDGEPAAVEWREGRGCVRSVAIPVASVGDLVLRESFVRLAGHMAGPCAGFVRSESISSSLVAKLAGTGRLATRAEFRPRDDVRSSVGPWLLGLALLLAIAELVLRRRRDLSPNVEIGARRPAARAA